MNHQQIAFRRKVVYLALMAALLLPLSLLGLPTSRETAVGPNDTFHILANLREKDGLAQRSLGKIDPSSETMRFATLGFRGLAATLLWNQAHEHKKKENWTALKNVLEQIGRLQPNFVSVWRFQGWNLSYNVSAEWDDYRQRYNWVLQGIAYLNEGQQYNHGQTRLIWDEAWSTAHKIGRSDEYLQFRRLFHDRYLFAESDDPRDHSYRPPDRYQESASPDNWLCAKEVFGRAIHLADTANVPLQGMAEEIFRSEPSKCQMRYADVIVEEGTFGDVAKEQWKQAAREWDEYGDYQFLFPGGVKVSINDQDRLVKRIDELSRQLDDLSATDGSGKKVDGRGIRAGIRAERREKLEPKERDLLDKPAKDLTPTEAYQVSLTQGKLTVGDEELAQALPESLQAQAQPLVEEIIDSKQRVNLAYGKRHLINYEFWKIRCQAEASDEGVEARRLLYDAQQSHRKDRASPECIGLYDIAFAKWRIVFDNYPQLKDDGELGDRICDEIREYRKAVQAFEADPKSKWKWDKKTFILKDLIDARQPTPPID